MTNEGMLNENTVDLVDQYQDNPKLWVSIMKKMPLS